MVLKASQERVKTLLKDTITLLCKNGLEFKTKFNIEALIGVTLDDDEVFLISMNELIRSEKAGASNSDTSDNEVIAPDTTSPHRGKKRIRGKRRRSNSSGAAVGERAVKQEPSSPSHEGFANPKAEDLWDGGDPPNLSPSGLMQDDEPDIKKQHIADEVDEEDIEDIVFVKEEGGNERLQQSCSYSDSSYSKDYSQSSEMQLTPVGAQDGSLLWSQTMTDSNQHHQQQRPRRGGFHQQSQMRTSTVTAEGSGDNMAYSQNPQMQQGPNSEQMFQGLHECTHCHKTFRSVAHLHDHEALHRTDYHYKCNVCGKGFSSTTGLRGHMSWHTGIKEFKCSLCEKEFRFKAKLKLHLLKEHQIE